MHHDEGATSGRPSRHREREKFFFLSLSKTFVKWTCWQLREECSLKKRKREKHTHTHTWLSYLWAGRYKTDRLKKRPKNGPTEDDVPPFMSTLLTIPRRISSSLIFYCWILECRFFFCICIHIGTDRMYLVFIYIYMYTKEILFFIIAFLKKIII